MNNRNITVSVVMLAYNHENYIGRAIDSILMQKTNFQIEILIGDDCSPDNTQIVIANYFAKYPEIIVPILRENNIGTNQNLLDLLARSKGRYIALLEGDDFWTDSNKLQEQVDFLDSHPEFIGMTHKFRLVDKDENPSNIASTDIYCNDREYKINHFEKWLLPSQTATIMFRNLALNDEINYKELFLIENISGDRKLALLMALQGRVYCSKEIMSSYRYNNSQGTSYSAQMKKANLAVNHLMGLHDLEQYAKRNAKINLDLNPARMMLCYSSLTKLIKDPGFENIRITQKVFLNCNNRVKTILFVAKQILIWPLRRIKSKIEWAKRW